METTFKISKSYSTLTIKADFDMILEENFVAICHAIANRGVALKELLTLFDRNEGSVDEIVRIIKNSLDVYQAANNLCVKLGVSEPTAKFVLALPLSILTSLTPKYLKKKCDEYNRIVGSLNV